MGKGTDSQAMPCEAIARRGLRMPERCARRKCLYVTLDGVVYSGSPRARSGRSASASVIG